MPHLIEVFYNIVFFYVSFYIAYKRITPLSFSPYLNESRSNESAYRLFFICAFLFSLFTFFGGDAQRYKEFVESGYQDAYYRDFFSYERFYVWLASKSMGSIKLWKSIVYGASIVLSMISIKRLKISNYYTLICFAICALPSYGSTRAVLAYSTFLFGLSFMDAQNFKYLLFGAGIIVSSLFFHSSMILPILLFPFALFFTLTPKKLYLLIALFPLCVYLVGYIPSIIEGGSLDFAEQSTYKYEQYVNRAENAKGYYSSFMMIVYNAMNIVFIMMALWACIKSMFTENLNSVTKTIIKFSFLLAYVALAFSFSSLVMSDVLYGRYFTMVPFFIYAALPFVMLNSEISFIRIKRVILLGLIKESWMWIMILYYESVK